MSKYHTSIEKSPIPSNIKTILMLLILTFSPASKAEESRQATELKARCEELGKETEEKYIYGKGELKRFKQAEVFIAPPPPTDDKTSKFLETPQPFIANFITLENKPIEIIIPTSWDKPEASFRERKPIVPIPVVIGENYIFCYKVEHTVSKERYSIDNPKIQIIKD